MIPGQLEYLISSLPYLPFQQSKEVRDKVSTTFRKYAGAAEADKDLINLFESEVIKFLSPAAFELIKGIDLKTIHHRPFRENKNRTVAAFAKYRYHLKLALLKQRMDPQQFRKKWSALSVPPLALTEGTPLEKEIQLMQLQWKKLEELATGHHFDLDALIIYKLKLMILDRWWTFDEEKGFRHFNQVIQAASYGG